MFDSRADPDRADEGRLAPDRGAPRRNANQFSLANLRGTLSKRPKGSRVAFRRPRYARVIRGSATKRVGSMVARRSRIWLRVGPRSATAAQSLSFSGRRMDVGLDFPPRHFRWT